MTSKRKHQVNIRKGLHDFGNPLESFRLWSSPAQMSYKFGCYMGAIIFQELI